MKSPYLLTPGPLTTSDDVKQAMLRDWGSRDDAFIAMNRDVCGRLTALAGAEQTHICVPLQGSGTFVVEARSGAQAQKYRAERWNETQSRITAGVEEEAHRARKQV